MTAYLTLPRLHVQQANIYNAAFLVGGPPVLAAWFMAHALERELNKGAQTKIQMESLAFVHHNMEPLGEFQNGQFSLQQRRGAAYTFDPRNSDYSSKNPHVLSLQPVACAHMEVSLVIGFDTLEPYEDIEKAAQWLRTGRLAGGLITSMGKPSRFSSLKKALKEGIRTGFLVMDRRDLMEKENGKNRAELFVDALGTRPTAENGIGWLSAACLGYAAITPFEQRAGAREGYLHAFAEPLIGLVQYRSLRNILQEGVVKRALWRSDWCAPDVFVIYQEPHPKSNQPQKE